MKLITVLGTRPEIIKLSPILPKLDREFNHILIHTGQHYDYAMDEVFFQELKLAPPKYNLHVGSHPQGKQVALMLEKIEEILQQEKPDAILVQGDTNSTLAGALAAAKMNILVIHLEAGCRSFNSTMPEEINRIIADHIANLLIPTDEKNKKQLLSEGIPSQKINVIGSTIYEAVERNKKYLLPSLLAELKLVKDNFLLVTVHRAENTNSKERLQNIIQALNLLAEKVKIVFPIHPRTKKILEENHLILHHNIQILPPQSYLHLLTLLSQSKFCLSDSGGIQEEALACNVPCLILREETEWTSLVEAGKNILAGTTTKRILAAAILLLENNTELERIKHLRFPYDQEVSDKIINAIRGITP